MKVETMRRIKRATVNLMTAVTLWSALPASAAESNEPAYVIVQVDAADPKEFERYQRAALPAILENKGEALVATEAAEVLEGRWPGNWTVVLKFPSLDAAKRWYASQGYQAAIPVRKRSSRLTNMVIVKSYRPD